MCGHEDLYFYFRCTGGHRPFAQLQFSKFKCETERENEPRITSRSREQIIEISRNQTTKQTRPETLFAFSSSGREHLIVLRFAHTFGHEALGRELLVFVFHVWNLTPGN